MSEQSSGSNDKVMGVLSYLGILVLIPIFAAKDSSFARYHANQGLILCIAQVALSILSAFLPYVISLILSLVSLVLVVFAIIGIVNAVKMEEKPLPLIGGISLLK